MREESKAEYFLKFCIQKIENPGIKVLTKNNLLNFYINMSEIVENITSCIENTDATHLLKLAMRVKNTIIKKIQEENKNGEKLEN